MPETERRPWSELLPDIVSIIAKKLQDPVELLAFRATCRKWRRASFRATAKLKESSLHQIPWLLYQESENEEECILHNFTTQGNYNIKLPELIGTNILGSFYGWILLFNPQLGAGKIFFFCPLSHQQIHLPDLGRHFIMRFNTIAVLSNNSSPTTISNHRTICVITRANYLYLNIYILRPGAQAWDKVDVYCGRNMLDVVTGGTFNQDENLILFNYKDKTKAVVFNFQTERLEMIPRPGEEPINPNIDKVWNRYNDRKTFIVMENYLELAAVVRDFLSMDDQTLAPIHVWGTRFWRHGRGNEAMLSNENNVDQTTVRKLYHMGLRRGIWIQPRLFDL